MWCGCEVRPLALFSNPECFSDCCCCCWPLCAHCRCATTRICLRGGPLCRPLTSLDCRCSTPPVSCQVKLCAVCCVLEDGVGWGWGKGLGLALQSPSCVMSTVCARGGTRCPHFTILTHKPNTHLTPRADLQRSENECLTCYSCSPLLTLSSPHTPSSSFLLLLLLLHLSHTQTGILPCEEDFATDLQLTPN